MKFSILSLFFCLNLALPSLAQKPKIEEVKKEIKDNFIELKGGDYLLGKDNIPISLSPFAISPTEVTYRQMEDFAMANGLDPEKFHGLLWGESNPDRPAVNVNWFDAIRYADWLSSQSGLSSPYTIYGENGDVLQPANAAYWNDQSWLKVELDISKKGYRLPTEAEWEYAASGYEVLGRKQKYAGTDQEDSLQYYAWYYDNSVQRVHKIARLKPNVLSIYDMSGNAMEWCFDEFKADAFDRFKNQKNPFYQSQSRPYDLKRTIRGGDWSYNDNLCLVQFRLGSTSNIGIYKSGFRLSRTL